MAASNSFVVPLNRREAVTARLRADITTGKLAPGQPITDAELAERLNVSITPIREAVVQLIAEGLIVSLPNKRRRVAMLTQTKAIELTELIGILMSAAVKRASVRLEVEQWSALLAKVVRASRLAKRTPEKAISLLTEVSHEIADAAGNTELSTAIRTTRQRIDQLLALSPGQLLTSVLIPGWIEALTLLSEGKGAAACARLDKMHTSAAENLSKRWEDSVTPQGVSPGVTPNAGAAVRVSS
jgi:DNA-binding GntR family transcriptional regulator